MSQTDALLPTAGTLYKAPFRHIEYQPGQLLDVDWARSLQRSFPSHLLQARERRTGEKSYSLGTVVVFDDRPGQRASASLDAGPHWDALMDVLIRPEYRAAIARQLEVQDEGIRLEVRLSQYDRGGWMARHTDRPDKLFSQNIYLAEAWSESWGGALALFEGATTESPAKSFYPGTGNSVAFVRSDTSWHEVLEVGPSAEAPRLAVLIHGYTDRT